VRTSKEILLKVIVQRLSHAPCIMAFLRLMLKINNMKANEKFYYVEELKLYVKLSEVTSIQLEKPLKSLPSSHAKCCLIVGKSVFWCESYHFNTLKDLLL
tara:strand:+ start:815 stop:1114 length:300 start_codon:yes stop_codon:yes gene_type:complete